MTGFARESGDSSLGTLTWELRSVNHRYLDIQFKLPDELRPQEHAFRRQVATRLKRGKIECAFHFRRAFDEQSEMQLNKQILGLLATRIEQLTIALPESGSVDPVDVLRWPGVVEQPEIDVQPLITESRALLDVALDAIGTMRAREGERIGAMLEARCAEIEAIAGSVHARMPEVLDAARAKQRERIDKLDVEADPARLEIELALIAQKMDIDEELDRLESHLHEIRANLARDEAVGRRLDFLMQELNREANTIASKSADTQTTSAAVDLKVLIEQMREQIQNIE